MSPTLSRAAFAFTLLLRLSAGAEEPRPPAGFRALFNGRDLAGWYGWNPHLSAPLEGDRKAANLAQQRAAFAQHWRVEDGELINSGTGPYATTEEALGDVEIMLEYRTVAGADSGVYLRGNPQVQIWDITQPSTPDKPDRHPGKGSGGLFNNPPRTLGRDPLMVADKPFGQWNQLRIQQVGARTWVWLNARAVVEGAVLANYWDRTQPLPARGPLMLQTHGGEIRWRNLFVRDLSPAEVGRLSSQPQLPEPTAYDVPYGPHPKQVLHFWRAESAEPTPVLLFIHGGGWRGGGRLSGLAPRLPMLLQRGISVVSVGYRFIDEATADGEVPPVRGPLYDAARALQLVRSKAAEWRVDKRRIAATGGSAGACTSLWLAFHPDLADPQSSDPVARESTRLLCAAVSGAQTTLDPQQMREWTPNSSYGGHAFFFTPDAAKKRTQFEAFLAGRESILPWIAEYSPYALVTPDDPPVYLTYNNTPALGQPARDPTHSANFGVKLQEHCRAQGVECELAYPGAPGEPHASMEAFLLKHLAPAAK